MNQTLKISVTVLITAIVASLAALWAWNTLAELFGAPAAKLKHIVAMFLLVGIFRFLPARRQRAGRYLSNE